MEHNRHNFFSFWTIFCPFTPLTTQKTITAQKIKISKKMKKAPGDIILHKCTKNLNICHTVPEIWRVTDVIIFNLGHFFPFYPLNTSKHPNFTKMNRKQLEILSCYTSVPKIIIICYTVPEIWCVTNVIVTFHFGLFFAILPPYHPKKSKSQKNEKNAWRYHHFTNVHQKL